MARFICNNQLYDTMNIKKSLIFIFCSITVSFAQQSLVNFSHLNKLIEPIVFKGDSVEIVHIYSDYPEYEWVDAGEEGIACVDDAARASVAYLRYYEITKDQLSLRRAKKLLRFILAMQSNDGLFYNFINADHSINRTGKTSFRSLGWWTARGVWSLGLGCRIFEKNDPMFSAKLRAAVEQVFPHLDTLLLSYGSTRKISGYTIPEWLLYESGSDATTELILGLTEYYKMTRADRVRTYIMKLCQGMIVMQNGNVQEYPYGLHRSWQTMWHAWGNSQTQVLAEAGFVLDESTLIESAQKEADGYYTRLLIKGFKREFDVADTSNHREFEQIAYDIRPITVGLLRLYEATNDSVYLTMAKIAASWFFGNNAAGVRMYDPSTGLCFDGIQNALEYSKNSGAESTIEALNSLIELQPYVLNDTLFPLRRTKHFESNSILFGIFSHENEDLGLVVDKIKGTVHILKGNVLSEFEKTFQ